MTPLCAEENTPAKEPIGPKMREGIEWCEIRHMSANRVTLPRVLLVGDSIVGGYKNHVNKKFNGIADVSWYQTSRCMGDPVFDQELEMVLGLYDYAVIYFNNGLHGAAYSDEDYKAGYEKALQYITKNAPKAKLVLALSTPLKPESKQNKLNPQVDVRNQIVRDLAKKYNAEINDLHSISKGHPEYYRDAYHYKPNAIELQGKQVADTVLKVLEK